MMHLFSGLTRKRGQGLVEYALILVLVSVVVVVILSVLGAGVNDVFEAIAGNL